MSTAESLRIQNQLGWDILGYLWICLDMCIQHCFEMLAIYHKSISRVSKRIQNLCKTYQNVRSARIRKTYQTWWQYPTQISKHIQTYPQMRIHTYPNVSNIISNVSKILDPKPSRPIQAYPKISTKTTTRHLGGKYLHTIQKSQKCIQTYPNLLVSKMCAYPNVSTRL